MVLTFGSFLALLAGGAPMVFVLGVAGALTLALTTNVPMVVVAQRLYGGVDSFAIMAIPFFVLAGLIMEKGGIARRMVDLAAALVGWMRGSLYQVSTVTGTGLAAISGSGSADTAAIGAILVPEMRRRRYDVDYAAAIIAAAGALAPIIPPSIIMIVVAMISNLSVGAMFLGGLVPGVIAAAGILLANWLVARRDPRLAGERTPFSFATLRRTALAAIPALAMPVIVVVGIIGGVVTPTEASALAVAAGLIISLLVYREMTLADLPDLLLRAAGLSATVMIIIATASVYSWLIAIQNVPALISGWFGDHAASQFAFILAINVLLLVVGMFLESISAILILLPVLMPVALQLGLDPIHVGVLVSINLSIGLITPPYGICLFVASTVAERPIGAVSRRVWIPLIPLLATLLLISYAPGVVLFLPRLLM